MSIYHTSVMPQEALEFLAVKKDHWYIDCNLGGGGHTELILKAGGRVIGIDLDADAIHEVAKNHHLTVINRNYHFEAYSDNLILYQSNFSKIAEVLTDIISCHPKLVSGSSNLVNFQHSSGNTQSEKTQKQVFDRENFEDQLSQITQPKSVKHDEEENKTIEQFNNLKFLEERQSMLTISGILFDLGVSTYQLEKGSRGFSFSKDAPLDMRMDSSFGASAKDLVNGLYEKELAEIFDKYAEESFAKPIAKKIVEYRKNKPIETTGELAKIVTLVKRFTGEKIHPATKVFQALRIAVNDELHSLEIALPKAFELLAPQGRMVVISFHSLEDRIVKNIFRDLEQNQAAHLLTAKPIETSELESKQNPPSRSAKLRAIQKLI